MLRRCVCGELQQITVEYRRAVPPMARRFSLPAAGLQCFSGDDEILNARPAAAPSGWARPPAGADRDGPGSAGGREALESAGAHRAHPSVGARRHRPHLAARRARWPPGAGAVELAWVVEEPFLPLVAPHPAVTLAIPVATRRWRRHPAAAATRREVAAARAAMREFSPDLALDPQGLVKSAVWAGLSGAPERVGLARAHRRELLAGAVLHAHAGAAPGGAPRRRHQPFAAGGGRPPGAVRRGPERSLPAARAGGGPRPRCGPHGGAAAGDRRAREGVAGRELRGTRPDGRVGGHGAGGGVGPGREGARGGDRDRRGARRRAGAGDLDPGARRPAVGVRGGRWAATPGRSTSPRRSACRPWRCSSRPTPRATGRAASGCGSSPRPAPPRGGDGRAPWAAGEVGVEAVFAALVAAAAAAV